MGSLVLTNILLVVLAIELALMLRITDWIYHLPAVDS
jgi:hypothetical protein